SQSLPSIWLILSSRRPNLEQHVTSSSRMTLRTKRLLLMLYAVFYSSFLCRNASYSPKRFSNNSMYTGKNSPAHLVNFGIPFSALQKTRMLEKLSVFSTQLTNVKTLEGLSLPKHYASYT